MHIYNPPEVRRFFYWRLATKKLCINEVFEPCCLAYIEVPSFPQTARIESDPPEWREENELILYIFPAITVQQSFAVLCFCTSWSVYHGEAGIEVEVGATIGEAIFHVVTGRGASIGLEVSHPVRKNRASTESKPNSLFIQQIYVCKKRVIHSSISFILSSMIFFSSFLKLLNT
jgi:hypothetical protein